MTRKHQIYSGMMAAASSLTTLSGAAEADSWSNHEVQVPAELA